MFGLTFDKLALIAIIAVVIVGPERLPLYAGRLAALIRGLRDLTDTAKARLTQELGPDADDIDWKKLDPRQYDPRRIIREALADDEMGVAPAETGLKKVGVPVGVPRAGSDGRYRRPAAVVSRDAASRDAVSEEVGVAREVGVAERMDERDSVSDIHQS